MAVKDILDGLNEGPGNFTDEPAYETKARETNAQLLEDPDAAAKKAYGIRDDDDDDNTGDDESVQDKARTSENELKNAADKAIERIKTDNFEREFEPKIGDEPPNEPPPPVEPVALAEPPERPRPRIEPPQGNENSLVKKSLADFSTFRQYWSQKAGGPVTKDAEDAEFMVVDSDKDKGNGSNLPPKEAPPTKAGIPGWVWDDLHGRMLQSSGRGLGNLSRGIGQILGAGARALGNIPAALDNAGARQKAAYGDAGGNAMHAIGQGVGEAVGTGYNVFGDIIGSSIEDTFGAGGSTMQDYANHKHLQALQEDLFEQVAEYIERFQKSGVPVDKAGLWDFLKNLANSYGLSALGLRQKSGGK
jgi:hypothetical protein